MGAYGGTDGGHFAFVQDRTDFTLRRIARATGKQHRAQDDADGQEFWSERFQAVATQPRACKFAGVLRTQRCTNDRHVNNSG